ncbi:hypothetical protein J437_LFUL007237 [Ladona fulva]|uniref:Peptidase M24 C-terminal domain-containing protein n=1 Tax=Ladona fulva TaxID=123851 RepID=A0A8K0JX78_LADFU|nr:hypothetical protein J437_LFUL007237 [Ladona fulva]
MNFDSTYKVAFEEGNFFSDEPGYYQEGEFGVRLENVLEVVKVETKYKFDGPYLGFRSVTLVPFEPKLINLELLSNDQRRMLNNYNAQIRTTVGAELKRQKRMHGFYWMMSKTVHTPECKTRVPNSRTTSSSPPSILSGVCHPIALALIALVSYLSS